MIDPQSWPTRMPDVVVLDRRRLVALAVPAKIRGDRAVSRLGQRRKLMPPGIPGLGKAVEQQNQRALAHLGDPQLDPVRLDDAQRRLGL
jgi:hypothetical protein